MKFLMFADLHYYPGKFYGTTWDTLRFLQRRAEEENCDLILHAGDFCHGPSLVPDFVKAYNDFHIPSYHCLGNHDTDNTPYEETLKLYNMPDGHYFFDCKGYRFIVLDANYCKINGEYIHYDMGNYYAAPECRDFTPPEQLEWLRETIDASPYPCILYGHDSYERTRKSSKDYKEVQQIINEANKKSPHKVLMAMNGHHHRDHLRILDGVLYWDVNSVYFDWVSGMTHDQYPKELSDQWEYLSHSVAYNDPLYAIVTLEGNTITIQGTESSMLLGVTRETIGAPVLDEEGRGVYPRIQSAKITLH
ncbi:MAG: metallophosphoesterase [Firmicutes bacterium]|nr:metallophosphoesterase [Bacillota bacterium]